MTDAARPQPESPSRRARWVLGLIVAALVGLAGYGVVRSLPRSAPDAVPDLTDADPRLTFDTPYRNVRPDVAYVGDAACAACHDSHAQSYHRHPMGQSMRPVGELPQDTRPEGNPFSAMGLQFRVERRGGKVLHRELLLGPDGRTLAETAAPVRYVVGSGANAISYLIEHEGTLTQSPITWFVQKKSWDMSPGFLGAPDRFERPILAGCLFCHCNHAEADADTRSNYRPPIIQGFGIGCERCHGPGTLHVRAHQGGKKGKGAAEAPDFTIVNPGRLGPDLQEAVCAQCHLGGKERILRRGRDTFDYRPGMPLDLFWRVFVFPPEAVQGSRVAGHVEQIHTSRCFQKSAGKLGCISCHDPHTVPDPKEKAGYYRESCLQCHQTRGCTEPLALRHQKAPGDDCTVCHMPQEATNISHVALTDHRILRRPDPRKTAPVEPDPLTAARLLLPFGHNHVDEDDPELVRDLAVALVTRARSQVGIVRARVSHDFAPRLAEMVQAHPEDLYAREGLAVCLAWQGQMGPALEACDETLARAPRRELVLCDAGLISQRLGLADRSLAYWQRALAVNPWSTRYRFEVAKLLSLRGDWEKAAAEGRRIVSQNGAHAGSRLLLTQYYLQKGKRAEARAELETALALHPPNEAQLRQRFAELLR